jgi:butyryl-CoA dehydrogenase
VSFNNGQSYQDFLKLIEATCSEAAELPEISDLAAILRESKDRVRHVTGSLLLAIKNDPDKGLANATLYLDMFGQLVIAWIWLRQAIVASCKLVSDECEDITSEVNFYQGKLYAANYFIKRELPQTIQTAALLELNEDTCFHMRDEYF